MDITERATLLSVIRPWPIAINLVTHLPAGDLINLARTNSSLRAALHGFAPPYDPPTTTVRSSLHVGAHQTSYWMHLKSSAPFLCASPTHTKGTNTHPCRYCSTPVCEACIVRSSFAKPSEKTFQNRIRYLCKSCWNTGNLQKKRRFTPQTDGSFPAGQVSERYNFVAGDGEFCSCTSKDGWVCQPCKEIQNIDAHSAGGTCCFGEACAELLEEDKDRRRICLWCDRPMLRGRASMESRLAFDQKMIDARVRTMRRMADPAEEYLEKRLNQLRMSRRELRGDDAVEGDPTADLPQFVRHLDTINYRSLIEDDAAPTGERVFQSKSGEWKYDIKFLLSFRRPSERMPEPARVRNVTRIGGRNELSGKWAEQTNQEKHGYLKDFHLRKNEKRGKPSTAVGAHKPEAKWFDPIVLTKRTEGGQTGTEQVTTPKPASPKSRPQSPSRVSSPRLQTAPKSDGSDSSQPGPVNCGPSLDEVPPSDQLRMLYRSQIRRGKKKEPQHHDSQSANLLDHDSTSRALDNTMKAVKISQALQAHWHADQVALEDDSNSDADSASDSYSNFGSGSDSDSDSDSESAAGKAVAQKRNSDKSDQNAIMQVPEAEEDLVLVEDSVPHREGTAYPYPEYPSASTIPATTFLTDNGAPDGDDDYWLVIEPTGAFSPSSSAPATAPTGARAGSSPRLSPTQLRLMATTVASNIVAHQIPPEQWPRSLQDVSPLPGAQAPLASEPSDRPPAYGCWN